MMTSHKRKWGLLAKAITDVGQGSYLVCHLFFISPTSYSSSSFLWPRLFMFFECAHGHFLVPPSEPVRSWRLRFTYFLSTKKMMSLPLTCVCARTECGWSVCPQDLVTLESRPVSICRDCTRHVKDCSTISPSCNEYVIDGLREITREGNQALKIIFFIFSSGLEGSSSSSQVHRGVKPVYLRCSQGSVSWLYPRGALRVVLRYGTAGKEFQVPTVFFFSYLERPVHLKKTEKKKKETSLVFSLWLE